ncbi:MAG: FtsQ-type POTRA domain-containing protein [Acidimicrobiia bacterium]|nr:FtsQ-type POTRA domain-containing protein [Acidimicrobiia bacterium]
MSAIDPRIAKRRHIVAEHGARRRLRSMIIVALLLGLVGLGWWATQSELLDIDNIALGGSTRVDVGAALATAGVSEGTPLLAAILAADEIEEALEANPWVSAATVNVLFPGRIEIDVLERSPAAVVSDEAGGWSLVAHDLTRLGPATDEGESLARITDPSIVTEALAFLSVLGDGASTTLSLSGGELWVDRGGVVARLGRPSEMEAKAAAFLALLTEDIPQGWAINLIAPSRPALFELEG